MDLSIIIVNWNSGDLLEKCLDSIYRNRDSLDLEIFVVDNASSDQSLSCLKSFREVKLIRNKTNKGFSYANNIALERAKGRFVLLLNPDTQILKNSLKKMVDYLKKHLNVGVLGCRLLNSNRSIQPSCHAFLSLPHVFFEVSQINRLFPKNNFFIKIFRPLTCFKLFVNYANPDYPVEVDSVMGSCFLIRKEALSKTGLLDENFFLYHEEMELSYRMWQSGYKVLFFPDAEVIHHREQSVRKVQGRVFFERCRSILLFFHKHKPKELYLVRVIMLLSLVLNLLLPFKKEFYYWRKAFGLCFKKDIIEKF